MQTMIDKMAQNNFMDLALEQAVACEKRGEIPVGAVIVKDNQVVAQAGNRIVELKDTTAHAEVLAIRAACEILGNERLIECDLYTTLEPCTMCAAAISYARIRRLYYGAEDVKFGAVDNGVRFYHASSCHHRPEVYGGICGIEAATLLKTFFRARR
jgi:tRNA(adenine34) deaminase